MKAKKPTIERISSGIAGFDSLVNGGLPKGSVTVLSGSPGAGKTTFAQQACFYNAEKDSQALFFQTLSEPAAKTIKCMSQFNFFAPEKLNNTVHYVDLGGLLRAKGIAPASDSLMEHIKRVKPSLVVIDSFKVFEDLTGTREGLRKFTYEIAIQLMAWEINAFLLGEYHRDEIESSPLASVVDGIISMTIEETSGKACRMMRIMKMRGTKHDLNPHEYSITSNGIEVLKDKGRGKA